MFPSRKSIKNWSIDETAEWLVKEGFGDFTAQFISREINGAKLLNIPVYQTRIIFRRNENLERKFWDKLESIKNPQAKPSTTNNICIKEKTEMFNNRMNNFSRSAQLPKPPLPQKPHGGHSRPAFNNPTPRQQQNTFHQVQQSYPQDDDDEWSDDDFDDDDDSYILPQTDKPQFQNRQEPPPRPPYGNQLRNDAPNRLPIPPRSPAKGRSSYDDVAYLPLDSPQSSMENGNGIPQSPFRPGPSPPFAQQRIPTPTHRAYPPPSQPEDFSRFNRPPPSLPRGSSTFDYSRPPPPIPGNEPPTPARREPERPPLSIPQSTSYPNEEPQEEYEVVTNSDPNYPTRSPPRPDSRVISPSSSKRSSTNSTLSMASPPGAISRDNSGSFGRGFPRREGSNRSQGSSSSSDHAETDAPKRPPITGGYHRPMSQSIGDSFAKNMPSEQPTRFPKMPPTRLPGMETPSEKPPTERPEKSPIAPVSGFSRLFENRHPDSASPSRGKHFPTNSMQSDLANAFKKKLNLPTSSSDVRPTPNPKSPKSPRSYQPEQSETSPSRTSKFTAPGNRNVDSQHWYQNCDRQQAQSWLERNQQKSNFVLRPGRGADLPHSLTVYHENEMYNLQIRHRSDRNYALGKEKPNERSFPSAVDLIEYYMEHSLVLAEGKGSVMLFSNS